ncbi:MAG: hypothetical protein LC734_04415 [Acidobacteria bacterium]|nr:hypothetical protein [Acidobacteriota bacterium]
MKVLDVISTHLFLVGVLFALHAGSVYGQQPAGAQEISETDGVPVLLKHLPNYDSVRGTAVFARSTHDLRRLLGPRPVIELIELVGGNEAVAAAYPDGKVLIVEYPTPQAAGDADTRFRQRLAETSEGSAVFYRRIGNYSAFVFDAPTEVAAAGLLDQIKYEKNVQWLSEDPFYLKKVERAFIYTTRDIFIATVFVIVLGIVGSTLTGIGAGFLFFRYREMRRAERTAFSDAGGLTRLNLDELSEPVYRD